MSFHNAVPSATRDVPQDAVSLASALGAKPPWSQVLQLLQAAEGWQIQSDVPWPRRHATRNRYQQEIGVIAEITITKCEYWLKNYLFFFYQYSSDWISSYWLSSCRSSQEVVASAAIGSCSHGHHWEAGVLCSPGIDQFFWSRIQSDTYVANSIQSISILLILAIS